MPKVLTIRDVPPSPPTINVATLSQQAKAALMSRISDVPSSWTVDNARLPGTPWWIEVVQPYFTAREIMLATGLSRAQFLAYHQAGRIKGAKFVYTARRQKKLQPVVERQTYVRAALEDCGAWCLLDHDSSEGFPRHTSKRNLAKRERTLVVTFDQLKAIADRRFRIPRDVGWAVAYNETGICLATITFDRRGRIFQMSANNEDV